MDNYTKPVSAFRGIAVLMVLVFHTAIFSGFDFGPLAMIARTGYLGVDLFFVISGFVLYLPHAKFSLVPGSPKPEVWRFAKSRIAKIMPSYVIVLAVVCLASLPYIGLGGMLQNLVSHVFFVQNFFVDGFGPVISVFWSLAVEVQFYLAFPVLAMVFRREPWLVAIAMTMTALAYRFAMAPAYLGDEQVMRTLPAYLDLFAAGMLSAHAVVAGQSHRDERIQHFFAILQSIQCFVLALICISFADGNSAWFVGGRTLLGIVFGATMASCCLSPTWFRRIVANPALMFLATISYNVYLWHTVILIFMRNHGILGIEQVVMGWSGTILLSSIITFAIELPLVWLAKTAIVEQGHLVFKGKQKAVSVG